MYLGQISDQNRISCSFVAVQCCIWREMRCWRYTVQWFNKLDLGKLILLVAHRHTNQHINAALFHAAQKRFFFMDCAFQALSFIFIATTWTYQLIDIDIPIKTSMPHFSKPTQKAFFIDFKFQTLSFPFIRSCNSEAYDFHSLNRTWNSKDSENV